MCRHSRPQWKRRLIPGGHPPACAERDGGGVAGARAACSAARTSRAGRHRSAARSARTRCAPACPGGITASRLRPGAGVTITSAVDLTYYSVRDLDMQPRALREILPGYPADADRQHLSGQVRVQLSWRPTAASAIWRSSAPPRRGIRDSTLKALRKARFAPAQKNGRPVRARVVITVEYDWEGRQR